MPAGDISGLILAGGSSSRMGFHKAHARLAGETLLARAVHTLAGICHPIMVASRDPSVLSALPHGSSVILVQDEPPAAGPLGAMAAGLRATQAPFTLVLACDLALFPASLGAYMAAIAAREHGIQAVVPHWGRFWEPLAAVYARTCLPAITAAIDDHRRRVTSFYDQVRLRPVEEQEITQFAPPEVAFFNINRPEDLLRANTIILKESLPPGRI
ncbi:MAG TPA: molybdenum cofactor guanylyltransferase [Firmicutes bacterium]|nr:molybdenum cofactor guanylyltransferase [Bacillota bacterium]